MADALPEQAGRADDAANPAIADGDAPTGVSILRRERYEDPRDLVGEPFIRLHESQYWRWYEQLKSDFKTRQASSQIADAFLDTAEMRSGLQIRALKFQSLSSNSRELELPNFLVLVLGCIEEKRSQT